MNQTLPTKLIRFPCTKCLWCSIVATTSSSQISPITIIIMCENPSCPSWTPLLNSGRIKPNVMQKKILIMIAQTLFRTITKIKPSSNKNCISSKPNFTSHSKNKNSSSSTPTTNPLTFSSKCIKPSNHPSTPQTHSNTAHSSSINSPTFITHKSSTSSSFRKKSLSETSMPFKHLLISTASL